MKISAQAAKPLQQDETDKADGGGTIPFNKSYPGRLAEPKRVALKPMTRLAFDACLELAWRIDVKGTGKWLGCLRKKGRGPYTNLELAQAFSTSPARGSNHVKELREVGLLENVSVDGERYLRVTDFPARMDGSFYQDFGRPWDEEPGQEIAQKAILPAEQTAGIDCSESNFGVVENCSESNPGVGTDCSESNSALTEIAQKAIDQLGGAEPGDQQPQGLKGASRAEIGEDQNGTYKNGTDPDLSSSDVVVGGCAASTADDDRESLPISERLTAMDEPEEDEDWSDPEDDDLVATGGDPFRPKNPEEGAKPPTSPCLHPAPPPVLPDPRMRQFLIENMGVMGSRVDELMSRESSLTKLRHACHIAQRKGTSNPGAYLCQCLERPYVHFWAKAAEGWEDERARLQKEVCRALRDDSLGYEWRSYLTAEILTEEAAYLYELDDLPDQIAASSTVEGRVISFASLHQSMDSMLRGGEMGRADNSVIGGVPDYDQSPPVVRLLTNYGVTLTRAFLSIVEPDTDVDQVLGDLSSEEREKTLASSVARAPYPDFIDPHWADNLGVSLPEGNPDRTEDYLWLDPASEDAERLRAAIVAKRRQQETVALETAQRERDAQKEREDEQRLQQVKTRPKYEPLPDEVGTLCEEIGCLLNEGGVVVVLTTYGFSIGFEFLEKLFRREGLDRKDAEQLITRTLNKVYDKTRKDLLEQMIEATVSRAPYPVWFTQQHNSWWRLVMQSQADKWHLKPPSYEWQEMEDYRSLKDLTNKYKVGQPDEPYWSEGERATTTW